MHRKANRVSEKPIGVTLTMGSVTSFLDTRFAKASRVVLSKLIERTKHGRVMPAGTLVVMASGDRKLRVKILEADTPHRGFSEPLALNQYARERRVTANYLLWYLGHSAVQDYLLAHTTGSVILRVSRTVLHGLQVPLPTRRAGVQAVVGEIVLRQVGDPLSELIGAFYRDYRLNVEQGRFRTATMLAGAIAEAILYQLLAESGVSLSMLSGDRNLGFGKMLDYVRLLKLDQSEGFPIAALVELQKNRNRAVHVGLLKAGQRSFSREDLSCFDQVVKHFGI